MRYRFRVETIGQWPWYAKMLCLIFWTGLLFSIGYWWSIKPRSEVYSGLLSKALLLTSETLAKQKELLHLETYKQPFQTKSPRLPAEDMSALLEDISKIGVFSGLVFELFEPLPQVSHDFYTEEPIAMTVLGPYRQLVYFLKRIVQANRLLKVDAFDLAATEDSPALLRMQLTVKIVRLL